MNQAVCVRQDQPVLEALAQMVANDFSQLPVIDADGRNVGSILEETIVRRFVEDLGASFAVQVVEVAQLQDAPFPEVSPKLHLLEAAKVLLVRPAVSDAS